MSQKDEGAINKLRIQLRLREDQVEELLEERMKTAKVLLRSRNMLMGAIEALDMVYKKSKHCECCHCGKQEEIRRDLIRMLENPEALVPTKNSPFLKNGGQSGLILPN